MPLIDSAQIEAAYIRLDGTTTATADIPLGSNKLTGVASGTASTDAVNKGQLDAAVAGLTWKDPVTAKDYLGTRTITQIDALSPTSGQVVVAGDAGTPSAGTSDALVAGSVAEFDGTSWQQLIAGSGGFVPDGTRLLVHDETVTLFAPLTDGTDESKFADFDGTTNTPTLTAPADGDAVLVAGDGSVAENKAYTHDTGTATWVQFSSLAANTAGDGIDINSGVISTDLAASGGLKIVSTELAVEPADFAGTGLEDDGSDNLRIAAAAAGNGLAGGAGSALSVQADGDSVSVSASGVKAGVQSASTMNQTPTATSGSGTSTGVTLGATPAGDCEVIPTVNGVHYYITSAAKTGAFYLSSDGGTTAKARTAYASGDILYQGDDLGFNITTAMRISVLFDAIV